MVYVDAKTTLSYDEFMRIPLHERSETKAKVLENFSQPVDPLVRVIQDNSSRTYKKPTQGYALSVGATNIARKQRTPFALDDVLAKSPDTIDMEFISMNHDFYKRADESVDETLTRTETFLAQGGMHYVVQETSEGIIGTINGMKKGNTAAIFSYMVLPERRKKGVGKLLGQSMHAYLVEQGVTTLRAKTKNKYVYYLLTRGYGGDVLWKELYY